MQSKNIVSGRIARLLEINSEESSSSVAKMSSTEGVELGLHSIVLKWCGADYGWIEGVWRVKSIL